MAPFSLPLPEAQQRLLELLLSTDERNLQLGLTLLTDLDDKTIYTRALCLIAQQGQRPEHKALVDAFLKRYLSAHRDLVQQELRWYHWLSDSLEEFDADHFWETLRHYKPNRVEYEHYCSINPVYADFYAELATRLEQLGHRDEALSYLGRLLRWCPDSAVYLQQYALLLEQTPQTLPTRLHYLERAAQSPGATSAMAYRLAELYYNECQEAQTALAWLDQSVQLDPRHIFAWMRMADIARTLIAQNPEVYLPKTLAALEQCQQISPDNRPLLEHYGWVLLHYSTQPKQALDLAERAIRLAPLTPNPRLLRIAVYWYGFHDAPKALQLLEQFGAQYPQHPATPALRQTILQQDHTPPPIPQR